MSAASTSSATTPPRSTAPIPVQPVRYSDDALDQVLPAGIQALPAVQRRQSVFYDLLTVFKRSTVTRPRFGPNLRVPVVPKKPTREYSPIAEGDTENGKESKTPEPTGSKEPLDGEAFLHRGPGEGGDEGGDEEGGGGQPSSRQAILDRIRQKKEVIDKLRVQPWSMSRKRRTLQIAQKYLKQQESKVPKSHLYIEELNKRMAVLRRHLFNLRMYLIPWEGKIKRIESHFGSVVSSYFTFLRWIVFVNLIITFIVVSFIVVPEVLADISLTRRVIEKDVNLTSRKIIPEAERLEADKLSVIWKFQGFIRYSPMFFGYYSDRDFLHKKVQYSLRLAYFLVTIFIFAYSFFAILRKMAQNARLSKLSGSKAEQYIFNWKVFTGWDYTIGNNDTATNTVMAIVIKLRESIAEKRSESRHKFHCLRFSLRVLANLLIGAMLGFSIFLIYFAVTTEKKTDDNSAAEKQNASTTAIFGWIFGSTITSEHVPTIISTITHLFPMIFDLIGRMEAYHPRTALRVHLGRVLVLYVVNYLTLIFALLKQIPIDKAPTATAAPRTRRELMDDGYIDRNFSSHEQFLDLLMNGDEKFAENKGESSRRAFTRAERMWAETSSSAPSATSREFYRARRKRDTTQPDPTLPSKVDLFGPVAVNNPNAYLKQNFTGDLPPGFQSKRTGATTVRPFAYSATRKPGIIGPGLHETQIGGPDTTTKRPKKPKFGTTTTSRPRTVEVVSPDTLPLATPAPTRRPTTEPPAIAPRTTSAAQTAEDRSKDCWETKIGQEIVRLVTTDLIFTIFSILVIDFFRGLWIKYCASWWCWDIETTFPEYGEFKVAENVLHIINNQGMVWLGFFFAPLLPAINNIKLIIIMYIRGWACMTCNVPAREIFRASRSSNFYLMILLFWLMLCTLPVGYVVTNCSPSATCGPFAGKKKFYSVVAEEFQKILPSQVLDPIEQLASPGVIIPMMIFLMLIIYFLVSLVRGLREANTDLQTQLVKERTEEKKKIFELAGGGQKGKKEAEARDREKAKMRQHLTALEGKRREPWRQYNGKDYDPSLVASDSSSSSSSSSESESEPTEDILGPPPVVSSTAETVAVAGGMQRSLQSPAGTEDDDAGSSVSPVPPIQLSGRHPREIVHSSSTQFGKKRFGQSPSMNSLDVQSNVVEIATPEEIRNLLRNMDHAHVPNRRGFPRDLSSSLIFKDGSRRSSKRNSYISLYEYPDSALPTLVPSGSKHDVMKVTPAHRHLAITKEEDSSRMSSERESSKKSKDKSSASTSSSRDKSSKESKKVKKGKKYDHADICPEFQPWPSIEEAKEAAATVAEKKKSSTLRNPLGFFRPNTLPSTAIGAASTSRSSSEQGSDALPAPPPLPPHRTATQGSGGSPTRRFRISVSPTRRLAADEEGAGGGRRFVIKQETLPASSSTSLMSPRAPIARFGDDDSPRVDDPPGK